VGRGESGRECEQQTGGTFGWGMFNVQLASGLMREAAAQAYSVIRCVRDARPPDGGRPALDEFTDVDWTMVQGKPREYPV
jgi:hypothetical protein